MKKDLYEDPVSRRTDTKNVTERSCVGLECRVNSSADVKGCVVSSPEDGDGPRDSPGETCAHGGGGGCAVLRNAVCCCNEATALTRSGRQLLPG